MSRSTSKVIAFVASTVVALGDARADEKTACDVAFEDSELHLRPSESRLLDARAALRACALPSCQPWMIDDCTKRLVDVEARIPSVVFSAEAGDARVLEGETEIAEHLDGRAIEMNPGPHDLVAIRGEARATLHLVVLEGKKAQQAVFVFPDAPAAPAPLPPPDSHPPAERLAHPWARPLAGGLLAGALVATGIGIGFGVDAIGKKSDAHCDATDVCDGPLDGARRSAHVSTITFVVGGALALGAVATYFVFGRARAAAFGDRVSLLTSW